MTQFAVQLEIPGVLRATFDRPPINLVNDETVAEVVALADRIESDPGVLVLVIDSTNPDWFMARYDISGQPLVSGANPWSGLERFAGAADRIARAPVLSIASIRGRARGGGSEIALACDIRFASRERAVLGQPEVPFGLLPAGGAIERLFRLVGRARALEIVIGGEDYDAGTAERYGWINRAIADDHLDGFVTVFARRVASFDRAAIVEAKRLINRVGLPDMDDLRETITALPGVVASAALERRRKIRERAAALGDAFERDLGRNLGPADPGN
jgi:enoyl-CoA hydratase/carnithine racemase